MSNLNKKIDLSMFGCPVHKTNALAAAQTLKAGEELFIKLNNDAVNTVVKHLTENGFHCDADAPDVLTSVVKVTKND